MKRAAPPPPPIPERYVGVNWMAPIEAVAEQARRPIVGAGDAGNWWRVVFDAERTSYASLLADVSVWGPNEAKLRAGDVVEVLDEQSTLFALLYLNAVD